MKKVFLVANEKAFADEIEKSKTKKKISNSQKGISLVSLVIMIILLLILLWIVFSSSYNSIGNAGRSVFIRELSLVQEAATERRIDNQLYGTSEEITNKGFYKSRIKNPPANFSSFSDEEVYGYVIDLKYAHVEDASKGHDYLRFANNIESNIVEFGVDDVYIYDSEGNVFYAKGHETDDGIYYSKDEITKFGPEIVSAIQTIDGDKKSAKITVVVKKGESGDLSVTVGGEDTEKVSETPDGTTETFEITVYENKTYVIIAKEEGGGITTTTITVSELEVTTYTIAYEANGGANAPLPQQKTENVVTRLSTKYPVKPGSTFIGWSENPYAYAASYMPGGEFTLDKNTTLFAVWKEGEDRTYSIIYNANGGTGAPETVSNVSGEYIITSEVPAREGYGFLGWSEDSKATGSEDDVIYVAGNTITLTKNYMLYAVWQKGTYSVTVSTYPENAGTVTGNTAKIEGSQAYISTTPNPGFTFKNWTVKSGNVNLRNSSSPSTSFTMPSESVEIVANYDVGNLVVKYNANKGTGAPEPQEVEHGTKIEITNQVPQRAGYNFLGWSLRAENVYAEYHAGEEYTVTQNVVFYAVWEIKIETYTIKFNLNGGTGNEAGGIGKFVDLVKSQGATVTIPIGGVNEPYKRDYEFKGWSLAGDSDEVVLRPGDSYNRDANIELFAVWKDEIPPTVSLTTKQEAGSRDVKIVANAYDEGIIRGYAWTMSDTYPTAWETEGIGEKNVTLEKTITQKGNNYFWVKDSVGNHTVQYVTAYQITYDANQGVSAPAPQFQVQNTDLTLTNEIPTRDNHTFLGWSAEANPGNTSSDVQFSKGGSLNLNADTTLKAVWGETGFELSANTGVTQIDGNDIIVTVSKGAYTGNITVSSNDTEKATAAIRDNIITISPGTKIGDVVITVTEDKEGTSKTILVTVNRGERQLTLDTTELSFIYGDLAKQIGFSYNGKETTVTTETSNSRIATSLVSGKVLKVTPESNGSATITLILAQDDQYLEKKAEVQVTISKKTIVVTPKANQSKVYDGTPNTPTLTYDYTGYAAGEKPGFTGTLTREIGSNVGKYEIKVGTLALANDVNFEASNYTLEFSKTKVYFEITPKRIAVPTAITPQTYDATIKYGIAEGADYTRGGEFQKINAGTYTAIASLNDTVNHVWDDTGTATAKNIRWTISSIDISNATLETIGSKSYTGNQITPIPVLKYKGTSLVNGTDFTLSYSNNVNVGTATVTINGKGNFNGTRTTTFSIVNIGMQVDVAGYTGTFDNAYHSITVNPITPSSGYTIYYSTSQLTNSNYTSGSPTKPTYKDIGTRTVYFYIVAPNYDDYAGSAVVKINAKDASSSLTITGIVNKKYTGSAITQSLTVKDTVQNRTLTEGTDYTVTYTNNINVGTATLKVTGKGNYTGTVTKTFEILGDTITFAKSTEVLASSVDVTISKEIAVTTLQYKIDNGSWENYTGALNITKNCTIYARSMHNGNVIGSNQISITNACTHEYTTVSCTTDARCKSCGLLKEEKWGHKFDKQNPTSTYLVSVATCTKKAVYYYQCSNTGCTAAGTSTYEYGELAAHTFTSKTSTSTYLYSAATCTTPAYYYYKCEYCTAKGTKTYSHGNANGHTWVKNITSAYLKSAATCTAPATYYYVCSVCGVTGTDTYTNGNVLGHDFTKETINATYLKSEATCTVPAIYYYQCSRSGCTAKGTKTFQYGSEAGHKWQNATCTQPQTCSVCNATGTAALGHLLKNTVVTPANCVTKGSGKTTCSRSGCSYSTTYEIEEDALNHKGPSTTKVTKAATCTSTGTSVSSCQACGVANGTETIPALGHNYSYKETTPATCIATGIETGTCTRTGCGATTTRTSAKNTSNHAGPIKTVQVTAATCTTTGQNEEKCTASGCTSPHIAYHTVAMTGHNYADATCTLPQTCTKCGATTGNALGHDYAAATCTLPATCTRCGATTGKAAGHTYTTRTCTTAETCTKCGATRLPARGHSWKDATCTTPKTCTRWGCGATDGEALGHDWVAPNPANCEEPDVCSRCSATQGGTGHSYGYPRVIKAAKCNENGTSRYTCYKCGYSYDATTTITAWDYWNHAGPLEYEYPNGTSCTDGNTSYVQVKVTCNADGCKGQNPFYTSMPAHKYVQPTCTQPWTCANQGCSWTWGQALGHYYGYGNTLSRCTRCNASK